MKSKVKLLRKSTLVFLTGLCCLIFQPPLYGQTAGKPSQTPPAPVASQIKITSSDPATPVFTPWREFSQVKQDIKIDQPFTQAGTNLQFINTVTFNAPLPDAGVVLDLVLDDNRISAGKIELRDLDASSGNGNINYLYESHYIYVQYIYAMPFSNRHNYKLMIGMEKPGNTAHVLVCTLDGKYLSYNDNWDILTKISFFYGHALCGNHLFRSIRDEKGGELSKHPSLARLKDEDFVQWNLASFGSREEGVRAYEAVLAAVKTRFDPAIYKVYELPISSPALRELFIEPLKSDSHFSQALTLSLLSDERGRYLLQADFGI